MPWWLYVAGAGAAGFVAGLAWLTWRLESAYKEWDRKWR